MAREAGEVRGSLSAGIIVCSWPTEITQTVSGGLLDRDRNMLDVCSL